MKLIANTEFSWAHRGVEIETFGKGQEIETEDQDLIEVSMKEGWASEPKEEKQTKSKGNAPENKKGNE
jgi:hypothetical protein